MDLHHRVTEALLPTVVRRRADNDRVGTDRALVDSMRFVAMLMLLPTSAAAGAADGFLALFGPGFPQAADALSVMLCVPVIVSISQLQGSFMVAVGRPGVPAISSVCRFIVTLAVMAPLLIRNPGPMAAAIALLAGALAELIVQFLFTSRELDHPVTTFWRPKAAMALILATCAAFIVARITDSHISGLGGVTLALACGSAMFVLTLTAFGGITPGDRVRIAALRAHSGISGAKT
jgi:O-antigen/teichoic acid export membrane protein